MTTFDWTVLLIVALSTLFAFFRGVVRELIAMLAWVLGFIGAILYTPVLGAMLPEIPGYRRCAYVIAFALIIIGALLGGCAHRVAADARGPCGGPGLRRSLSRLDVRLHSWRGLRAGVRAGRRLDALAANDLVAGLDLRAAARGWRACAAALAAGRVGRASRLFADKFAPGHHARRARRVSMLAPAACVEAPVLRVARAAPNAPSSTLRNEP